MSRQLQSESDTIYILSLPYLGDCIAAIPVIKYAIDTYHKNSDYLVAAQPEFRCLLPFIQDNKFLPFGKPIPYNALRWARRSMYNHPKDANITGVFHASNSLVDVAAWNLLGHQLPVKYHNYIPLNTVDVSKFNIDFEKAVIISADETDPVRALPVNTILELVDYVISKNHIPILVGTKNNIKYTNCKAINLIGKTTISELASIIDKSICVIGRDGGTINLAGTTKTHIIAGYTTIDPKHRQIPRPEGLHFQIVPDIECQFCTSKCRHSNPHGRPCQFNDSLCVKSMTSDKFIPYLDIILSKVSK